MSQKCAVCGFPTLDGKKLCYFCAGKIRTLPDIYHVSEELELTSKKKGKLKECEICSFTLLTELEKQTGLCYYHLTRKD